MSLPDIKYDLHDSVIVSARYTDGDTLKLVVDLCGVPEFFGMSYEERPNIELSFKGVVSTDVKGFVNQLIADYQDLGSSDYLGARIDCLRYDTVRQSTSNNRYFFLDVDGRAINIHCRDLRITDL